MPPGYKDTAPLGLEICLGVIATKMPPRWGAHNDGTWPFPPAP